jgi:hypothetical protein
VERLNNPDAIAGYSRMTGGPWFTTWTMAAPSPEGFVSDHDLQRRGKIGFAAKDFPNPSVLYPAFPLQYDSGGKMRLARGG